MRPLYQQRHYDDDFAGPRWRYGLIHRPAVAYLTSHEVGDQILYSHRECDDPRFARYGTADWPREIPSDVAEHHGLVLIARVER